MRVKNFYVKNSNSIIFRLEALPNISRPCIESFPEEILIEIFEYLSVNDLKQAALTIHVFNEVISQSVSLMKKFSIKISPKRKWDFDTIASFERKHRNVKISYFKSEDDLLTKAIENLADIAWNLTDFEMNNCKTERRVLSNLLCLTENLRNLSLVNITFEESFSLVTEPPELKFLRNLRIMDCDFFGNIFEKASNLQKLSFQAGNARNQNLDYLQKILQKQEKLEILSLENVQFTNFLEDRPRFHFQLKRLSIHLCHFSVKESFEDFLESQNELQEVEMTIGNMKLSLDRSNYFEETLSIIFRKSTLRKLSLEFEKYELRNLSFFKRCINQNLKALKIANELSFPEISTFLRACPNIESLDLSVKEIDDESIKFINENLIFLTSLKIAKFPSEAFGRLKIKSLSSLHVHETNIKHQDWLQFVDNNKQITKLIVNFIIFMDSSESLIDAISKKLKLEHVELIDKWIGMKNEIYVMLCENCKNLKYLKLWNINVEKDFDDSDKEYLRSRNIKFHLFNDETLNTPMIPF